MTESGILKITAGQEDKIRIAAESTCELCREYRPLPLLEIHVITKRKNAEMKRDPSLQILVVCADCHRHIHVLPVPVSKQRGIVRKRSFYIRRDIRRIMGYMPKPYEPPENIDLSQIYEESFNSCPPDSYRLGG
jgi:hypothetical protein